jgi:hypothetical protein
MVVEDDAPEGFKDLSHAFTLFADSATSASLCGHVSKINRLTSFSRLGSQPEFVI